MAIQFSGLSLNKRFSLNEKTVLIVLRFLVLCVSLFLSFYNADAATRLFPLCITLGLMFLSNVALLFLSRPYFSVRWFRNAIFVLDVLFISAIIFFAGGMGTDLYLAYFLIIFMASSGQNVENAFFLTIVVASVYAMLLFARGMTFSLANPGVLLRIPFFFIISFIFTHYAQEDRKLLQMQSARMEKLSVLGELMAGVLHELKNHLTIIIGYANLLEEIEDPAKQKEFWVKIVKASTDANRIMKNILTFAASDSNTEHVNVDINKMVDNTLEMVQESLKMDQIKLVKVQDSNLPPVLGNASQLQQVIMNIVTNARYELVKSRDATNRSIMVTTAMRGGYIKIRVKDNGGGIKPENMGKIFDPFFSTKPQGEGTGLGLSICYRIINHHGGEITLDSKLGEGTTFTISLPASSRPENIL
jgi:signal transduction histidine kinase